MLYFREMEDVREYYQEWFTFGFWVRWFGIEVVELEEFSTVIAIRMVINVGECKGTLLLFARTCNLRSKLICLLNPKKEGQSCTSYIPKRDSLLAQGGGDLYKCAETIGIFSAVLYPHDVPKWAHIWIYVDMQYISSIRSVLIPSVGCSMVYFQF